MSSRTRRTQNNQRQQRAETIKKIASGTEGMLQSLQSIGQSFQETVTQPLKTEYERRQQAYSLQTQQEEFKLAMSEFEKTKASFSTQLSELEKELHQAHQVEREIVEAQMEELQAQFTKMDQAIDKQQREYQTSLKHVKQDLEEQIVRHREQIELERQERLNQAKNRLERADLKCQQAQSILQSFDLNQMQSMDLKNEFDSASRQVKLAQQFIEQQDTSAALTCSALATEQADHIQSMLTERTSYLNHLKQTSTEAIQSIEDILSDTTLTQYYGQEIADILSQSSILKQQIDDKFNDYKQAEIDHREVLRAAQELKLRANNLVIQLPQTIDWVNKRVERMKELVENVLFKTFGPLSRPPSIIHTIPEDIKSDLMFTGHFGGPCIEIRLPLNPEKELEIHVDGIADNLDCEKKSQLLLNNLEAYQEQQAWMEPISFKKSGE